MRCPPNRGQTKHLRAVAGHRIAAQQRRAKSGERLRQPGEKAGIAGPQHIAEQHPERLRAFGGEVGHVYRHQLPGDIGRVLPGEEMHPLDHRIMGKHERLAANLEHRAVVIQPARGGMLRETAQGFDEGELGGHGPSSPLMGEGCEDLATFCLVAAGWG